MTAGKINYIYNASGAKLQKIVTPTVGAVTTTDYLGAFQYENKELQYFPTAEGYYHALTNKYVFQYRDHLGNVRLSYSDTNGDGLITPDEILSENNYYPFGLQHQGDRAIAQAANQAAEKYKYNGKELQDELGINLYDYGARNYDAALGRWMNVDPLAEERQWLSPFNYVQNNPMVRIDPDGQLDDWYKEDDEFKWDDRVTDQKTAEKLHGGKAIYVGKEATISSIKNGKIMDKVGLHADGTVTKGGKRLAINSTMRFSNASGSSFQSRQTQGSFVSIGVDGALIGGFGFQVGLVSDAVGYTIFFINFNANIGVGGGAGWDAGTISPTGSNQFLNSDFDGNSGGYNAGISTPILDASWGKGGSVGSNWHATNKMNHTEFGANRRGYKTTQSGFSTGSGFRAGGMYSYGTTKVF